MPWGGGGCVLRATVLVAGMVRITRLPGKMALRSLPYHLSRNRWIQKKQSACLDNEGCAKDSSTQTQAPVER